MGSHYQLSLQCLSSPWCQKMQTGVNSPRFLSGVGWRGMFTPQFQNNNCSRQNLTFPFFLTWEGKLTRSSFSFPQILSTNGKLISVSRNNRETTLACWTEGWGRSHWTGLLKRKKLCFREHRNRSKCQTASNSKNLEKCNQL